MSPDSAIGSTKRPLGGHLYGFLQRRARVITMDLVGSPGVPSATHSSGRTNGNILLKRTKRSFDAIAEMFHKIVKKISKPPQMTLQNIVRKDKYDNVSANVLRPQ